PSQARALARPAAHHARGNATPDGDRGRDQRYDADRTRSAHVGARDCRRAVPEGAAPHPAIRQPRRVRADHPGRRPAPCTHVHPRARRLARDAAVRHRSLDDYRHQGLPEGLVVTMTPDAKRALSKTIRELREKILIPDLRDATERAYQ